MRRCERGRPTGAPLDVLESALRVVRPMNGDAWRCVRVAVGTSHVHRPPREGLRAPGHDRPRFCSGRF